MKERSLNLTVRYFASLRESSGIPEERVTTTALSATDLYRELAARHRFTEDLSALRVAINDQFSSWECSLVDGDTIVFIPPVAGG